MLQKERMAVRPQQWLSAARPHAPPTQGEKWKILHYLHSAALLHHVWTLSLATVVSICCHASRRRNVRSHAASCVVCGWGIKSENTCMCTYLGGAVGRSVVLKSMHSWSLSPYSGRSSHFMRSGHAKPYCRIRGAHPDFARSHTDLQ